MNKTPLLTVKHRAVTYYEHPTSKTTHGMISLPIQFKDPLHIRKNSHQARLMCFVRHGKVCVFPVTDPPTPAPQCGQYDKIVNIRVTTTNIFIKLPSKMMTLLNVKKDTHEVNWTFYQDKTLEGEIVLKEKI